jgi:hypothetical protein
LSQFLPGVSRREKNHVRGGGYGSEFCGGGKNFSEAVFFSVLCRMFRLERQINPLRLSSEKINVPSTAAVKRDELLMSNENTQGNPNFVNCYR